MIKTTNSIILKCILPVILILFTIISCSVAGSPSFEDIEMSEQSSSEQTDFRIRKVYKPDLIISSLTASALRPNRNVVYSYTVTNIGNATVNLSGATSAAYDNVSVQAYTSADTIYRNSGDKPAGGTVITEFEGVYLHPGQSISGSFHGGSYDPDLPYLVLKVDHGSVVSEWNENNNTKAAWIRTSLITGIILPQLPTAEL